MLGDTKVFILSQYDMDDFKRNMNAYQRIYHGGEHADVTLLLRKKRFADANLRARVRVVHAPVENRWVFLVYAVWYAFALRLRGCRIILTEPSGFAAVGFLAKYLFGYFWVMDVWDRPRWHAGKHESGSRQPLSDRLVFGIMRRADHYLLSVLPRAARDINPPPERSTFYLNAIELDDMAEDIPQREPGQPLQIAYAKSEFNPTLGVDLLVKAIEILHDQGVPVVVHIIGDTPDAILAQIDASRARDTFVPHGFTAERRTAFFRRMHVGVVPYMPYEDLSYIYPIKVMEHLSQGNPVIVSRLPGLCAMVDDGQNGLHFDPADPASLADAIARLQRDPDVWRRLARNALASASRFDARKKGAQIYRDIFERAGAARISIKAAAG